jgi:hypothetical protein
MRKLHILVEGPTEEVIVKNVIGPYLSSEDLYVIPSILETKPPAGGRPAHKGGVSSWAKILREIRLLLGDTSTTMLTTLIDYYGFPDDAPGMADRPIGSPYARVEHVESALADAVDSRRFLPHLVLHEIEAWVLADSSRLADLLGNSSEAARLAQVVAAESGPEMVNDGVESAPSKRIKGIYPRYGKTLDGPLVIADIGLDEIRQQCPHANRWLSAIETALKPLTQNRPTAEGQDYAQLPSEFCTVILGWQLQRCAPGCPARRRSATGHGRFAKTRPGWRGRCGRSPRSCRASRQSSTRRRRSQPPRWAA